MDFRDGTPMKTWGLDFGATGIKAIELSHTWQGYRVTNYGFYPYSGAEKAKLNQEKLLILKKIFPGGSKEMKNVVVSLPSHRMMVHRVALPFPERKKNQQVIKFEVESLLPFPVDQVIVDFYQERESSNGNQAMTFAARKEDLQEELSLMEEAGLDPECLVPEAMALFYLLPNLGNEVSSGALLDVGHEKTTMVVWSGKTLTLARSIPVAGSAMKSASSPLPAVNRLADEVQRTLTAYESHSEGGPVEKIYLTGGAAALPDFDKKIEGILGRPVTLLSMEGSSKSLLNHVPEEYRHVLSVALGAAFGGSVKEGERINFRQEEFASSKKAQKTKNRMILLLSYGILLVVLGVATFAVDLYLKERKYRDLRAEIRKEFMQAQPGVKKVVNEVQQMKNSVEEEKARVNALGGISKAASPLEILREFSMVIEPGWKVRVTDLIVEPESIEVSGEADSFETINQIKSRLEKSSLYKDVQLKTARASTVENVFEFKLQMKRGI